MKRYLFLKLGIAILVCAAAASPASQVPGNVASNRDENRQKNNHQNGVQTIPDAQRGDAENNLKDYQGVMGKPGVDFPVLTYIPRTKFNCRGKKSGYYADLETNCQVFHICDEGRKVSFLCPNGTIFQQSDLICDWWFKVDCASSPNLYNESAEQLYEETIKRKENRRVQQEQRRAEQRSKTDHTQNENSRQGREYAGQRAQGQAQRNGQSTFAKKDVNHYTSDQHGNRYNENAAQTSRNDLASHYKETQVPSETASFVSTRYNNGESKNYYKTSNDVGSNTVTYLPPKSLGSESASVKTTTERLVSRGGRTFSTAFAGEKAQVRNQVSDYLKSTTQHTIYSPTVPPFTSTRYTTRAPSTLPIAPTTRVYESKPVSTTKGKSLPGFYITKELNPTTTPSPTTVTESAFVPTTTEKIPSYSYQQNVFTSPVPTYESPVYSSTSNDFTAQTEIPHTTPATISHPSVASEQNTESDKYGDLSVHSLERKAETIYPRFGTTHTFDDTTTISISTSKHQETTEPLPSTESVRIPKQYDFLSAGFKQITDRNTAWPSVPTPFRVPTEASTEHFRPNTYLPKATNGKTPTPRPTVPTEYTTYVTVPPVTENLSNMIKTLQDLEAENPGIEVDKYLGSRPGLNIPPSAGPKTLHSLAIYFATALDNLVSNDTTDRDVDGDETTTVSTVDDNQVTLLSRTTLDKYNSLFNDKHTAESTTGDANVNVTHEHGSPGHRQEIDLRSLVEHDAQFNDLDGQQSRGPITSTPRIRQLAQVFTQALSAYLDDPDTFKKVLEEIRPTEPPLLADGSTEPPSFTTAPSTTTTTTEYRSYTKEEDEVLDFSDVDKSSTYKPFSDNSISSTPSSLYVRATVESYLNDVSSRATVPEVNLSSPAAFTVRHVTPTPNPVALILNSGLKLANSSVLQDIESADESSTEDNTESDDYFPFNTGHDEADIQLKATAKPYGFDVKPENSTPISTIPQIPPSAETWNDGPVDINQTDVSSKPAHSLLPPFKVSLLNDLEDTNSSFLANEEYLQSAHSQSFVSHSNSIDSDREGKSINTEFNETYYSTTDYPRADATVFTTDAAIGDIYTSTQTPSTTLHGAESATQFFTSRYSYYDTTTGSPSLSTNTDTSTIGVIADPEHSTINTEKDTTNLQHTTTYFPKEYTGESTTYAPKEYTTESTTYFTHKYSRTEPTTHNTNEYATETTTHAPYTSTAYTTTFAPEQTTSMKPVPENHWSTSPEVTRLWETTLYVDPLLINRNLEQRFSGNTDVGTTDAADFSAETTTEAVDENVVDLRFESTTSDYFSATAYTTTALPPTVTNEPYPHTTIIDLGIHSLLNSTELEIASSQAHQIFGNLDTAEQDLLIEKMKEAESNSTVRRLILLLVSTCDASLSNNKTVQETRNSILNALLNLPSNADAQKLDLIGSRSGKQVRTKDDFSITTTTPPETTSQSDELFARSSAILPTIEVPNRVLDVKDIAEDTRALELLRSLYSLAAKWGKK